MVSDEPAASDRLRPLDDGPATPGPAEPVADLRRRGRRASGRPASGRRWLWPSDGRRCSTPGVYPLLRPASGSSRCHDVELTEALLLGHAGRWGEPRSLRRGLGPADRRAGAARPAAAPGRAARRRPGRAVRRAARPAAGTGHRRADPGVRRPARPDRRDRAPRPVPAAGGGRVGRRADRGGDGRTPACPGGPTCTTRCCAELLGEPSPVGGPPRRLAELAAPDRRRVRRAGSCTPTRPAELLQAFARAGVDAAQHPGLGAAQGRPSGGAAAAGVQGALPDLDGARLGLARRVGRATAGSSPEYVPGGVVSGRWATRGGGALQIPKVVRARGAWPTRAGGSWSPTPASWSRACWPRSPATPGWRRPAAPATSTPRWPPTSFGGDRAKAKVALLGAMYGQTGGAAVPALAVLRGSYPTAFGYVEAAARTGEAGGLVRSWLGRTCPPPRSAGATGREPAEAVEPRVRGRRRGRARGRFTRNFVIQATAAEWALDPAGHAAHRRWPAPPAELVFFQHDEVIVHCPSRGGRRSWPRLQDGRRGATGGCCSATRRCASRSRSPSSTATPSAK